MSLKPEGVPVSGDLGHRQPVQLVGLLVQDVGDRADLLLPVVVGDLQHRSLGPLDQVARRRLAREHARLDLVRRGQQRPHLRVVADDPAVLARVPRGRDPAGELVDRLGAADLLELAVLAQRLGDRQVIDLAGRSRAARSSPRTPPRAARGRSARAAGAPRPAARTGAARRAAPRRGPTSRPRGCAAERRCSGRRSSAASESRSGADGTHGAFPQTTRDSFSVPDPSSQVPQREALSSEPRVRGRRITALTRAGEGAAAALRGDDHGLDGRGHVVGDLDDDHVGPGVADRVLEVDLAAVDADAARVADRVGDVLRGDRAEQPPVVARLLRDRQDGASEQRGVLAAPAPRPPDSPARRLATARGRLDRARRGGLGQLAGQQVVAQVARRRRRRPRRARRASPRPEAGLPAASLLACLSRQRSRSRSRSPRPPRSPRSLPPSATYGSSASSRARLTARATWLWWRRHAPVIRRERILPRSEMNRRSDEMSL